MVQKKNYLLATWAEFGATFYVRPGFRGDSPDRWFIYFVRKGEWNVQGALEGYATEAEARHAAACYASP